MAKQLLQQGMQEEGYTSVSQIPPIKITYESNAPTLANEITSVRQQIQTVLGINVGTQVIDFSTLLTAVNSTVCTKADYHQCLNKGLQMWELAWAAD